MKAFSGSVNMGIIRNGADGIQRHSLVSAGGLRKHAWKITDPAGCGDTLKIICPHLVRDISREAWLFPVAD